MAEATIPTAARHSSDSPDWYTPLTVVQRAREALGVIDLDPASDAHANVLINATRFYTIEDDALTQPWGGRVFLNPPGGVVVPFWRRLVAMHLDGAVPAAIWIGFSLEQLQTLQVGAAGILLPTDCPLCVPKARIHFIENETRRDARIARYVALGRGRTPPSSPSHANYIAYLGPDVSAFACAFETLGACFNLGQC